MKRLQFAAGILILLLVFLLSWWSLSVSPVNPQDTSGRQFTIAKGEGVREISKDLRDAGLVRDQVAFFLLVKYKLGIEKNIQAGTFQLSPSMTAAQVATQLTLGTEDIWITIPEGWRCEEVVEYLGKTNPSWQWPPKPKGNLPPGPVPTPPAPACGVIFKEGKIFPDTYRVPKDMSLGNLGNLLQRTFDQKTAGLGVSDGTLILASMVEREAKFASDRPLVASVLLNRLNLGMKLDIDATVQYALGKSGAWWPKDLTIDDLKIKSPYNTYTNAGLPPTPICSPGLSAIQAVLSPAKTDYIYYVSDKQGHLHFAKDLEEHNANVVKYLQK